MDRDEEDLIIACCIYEILQEQQRKKERKRKKQWIENLKRTRERQLAHKHKISVRNLRRNQHLGRHPKKNVSKDAKLAKDPNNITYYDEEENYETFKNTGITIKVEPGLTDVYQDDESKDDTKDFLTGCVRIKEEPNSDSTSQEEHLDSMIDVDNTPYIKQEDETCMDSSNPGIKIKIEPGLIEDDVSHDYLQ